MMKTLFHIRSQSEENNRYESEEQDRLSGLRALACFLNEFEKALIFIVGARNISNLNEQLSTANENYNKAFADKLQLYINRVR